VPISKDDYEAGLDPKAREILEFLRANPSDKGYTVMEVYASIYSEEEKSAHLRGSGGVGERFKEIQRWLDEFREQGYVKSKIVSATPFYSASE
jgi:DNA-binding transcriptional ArsR family regulator